MGFYYSLGYHKQVADCKQKLINSGMSWELAESYAELGELAARDMVEVEEIYERTKEKGLEEAINSVFSEAGLGL